MFHLLYRRRPSPAICPTEQGVRNRQRAGRCSPANTPMNAPGSASGVRMSAPSPAGAGLFAGTGLTRADARRLVMAETMSAFELAGSGPGQPTGQSPFPPIAEYA